MEIVNDDKGDMTMATKKTVAQAVPSLTPEEVSNIVSDVMRRFFDLNTTPAQDKRQIRLALVTVAEDTLRKVGGKHG